VCCPAGISKEHLQRAKSLSHDDQKWLGHERKDVTTRKQENKFVEEKLKIMHILEDNRLCETILMVLVGGPVALPTLAQVLESEQFNNKWCNFLWSTCHLLQGMAALLLRCVALLSYV
jgi:hypothetical protein